MIASNIFCYSFDYDDWPSTHINDSVLVRPFNGNSLDLRAAYNEVFSEEIFKALTEEEEELYSSNKIHKIRYRINMLPVLGEYMVHTGPKEKHLVNRGLSLMNQLIDAAEGES